MVKLGVGIGLWLLLSLSFAYAQDSVPPLSISNRLAYSETSLAGIGTTQTGAAVISLPVTRGTVSVGQTAFILPLPTINGLGYFFFNSSTTTSALMFPPVGEFINAGTTNAAYTVAPATLVEFVYTDSGAWGAH